MNSKTRLLLWIMGLALLLGATGVVALVMLLSDTPVFDLSNENLPLKIRLTGQLSDGPGEGEFVFDTEKYRVFIPDYARAIRSAANDPSIEALHLEIDSPSMSMAGAQELRDAVVAFNATNKRCVAWSKSYSNLDYYLASGCSTVQIHSQGSSMILGLRVQTQHFTGTLQHLGIEAEFERIGAYKSAPEAFTNVEPSEATREMMLSLLDSLHGRFVGDIAASRGMSESDFQDLIDDPPVTAKAALKAGLVDALRDEFEPEDWIGIRSYLDQTSDQHNSSSRIGVLHVQGTIVDGHSSADAFGGVSSGDKDVVAHLEDMREDRGIAAIVLRVNSPGGSAMASDVIWKAVLDTDQVKPVVVSMGAAAASGGYYISAPATRIFAQPGTITGSIGIFAGKMSLAGLYEKIGITGWSAKRGELADLYDPSRPFSDLERTKLREIIRDFYDTFIEKVAQGRNLSVEEVDALGQGRVWTGAQAVANGLADELGGLNEALESAASLAGLQPGKYDLDVRPAPATLFEAIIEGFEQDVDAHALLLSLLNEEHGGPAGELLRLAPVLERNGIAAAMPFRIHIQ